MIAATERQEGRNTSQLKGEIAPNRSANKLNDAGTDIMPDCSSRKASWVSPNTFFSRRNKSLKVASLLNKIQNDFLF